MSNSILRVYLPIEISNDTNLVQEIINWCEQNFGLGCKHTTLNIVDSANYQWSVNRTIFDNVFFEFRTQQQFDWFTLKWL